MSALLLSPAVAASPCTCGLCGKVFKLAEMPTHSWICLASKYTPAPHEKLRDFILRGRA